MTWSGASSGEHFVASNPAYPGLPQTNRAAGMLARNWPLESGIPILMTAPPTVTLSAADAGTALAGATQLYNSFVAGVFQSNRFTVSGAPVVQDGGNQWGYCTWIGELATWSMWEFITDSADFEWLFVSNANSNPWYRCSVNGQLVTAQAQVGPPSNGSVYRIRVTSGSRAFRRHTIEFCGAGKVQGVQALTIDTIMPSPRRGPRVIIVDNSMGESTGAIDATTGLTQTLAWYTGWDVWPNAYGGVGYVNPGPRTKIIDHIGDVINNAPDLVVWFVGINDYGQNGGAAIPANKAAIQAAALLCYQTVTAALPNVPQVALGPEAGTGNRAQSDGDWIACRDAIQAAALAAGIPFADPLGSGYLRGTGKVGQTNGSGNADLLVDNDGTHPSQAGHDAYARIVASVIAQAIRG